MKERVVEILAARSPDVACPKVRESTSAGPSAQAGAPEPSPSEVAESLFLAAIERDPNDPAGALRVSEVERRDPVFAAAVRAEVDRLLRDFERGGIADPNDSDGAAMLERALECVAASSPPPVSTEIPERLGNYRILRTLSLGPASAVLLAQQEAPIQRQVAIKLLFEDASAPRLAARVEAERQTLAALEHPNIARIYDYGIAPDHRPYMVMEHVGAGSVVEYCRAAGLPLRARVEMFVDACAAIRAAHALGVLHCDLKPANILVQVVGGEPHAKVIDFGIARTVRAAGAEHAQLSELPRALGTLASMSPEALVPGGPPLDTRTDVFGLGMVLLELAAMRPPRALPANDLGEALRIVLEEPIPPASRLAAASGEKIDPDLDAVIAKATARDKRERYGSVDSLLRDLESWLAGDDVVARQRPLGERVRRGVMRRKFAVLLALTAVLALVPLVSGMFRASATRDRALDAARDALALARELRDLPGTDDRRNTLLAAVAEETRAGLLARPGDLDLLRVRVMGIEEELLARLMRGDSKSDRSRELAMQAERMRREIVALRPDDLVALSDLSVALAYKLDTIRGEPGFVEAQREQLEIDISLHERDPKSRLFADNLSWTYQRVADRAWERGERELALRYLDKSAELGDIALGLDPTSAVSLLTAAAGHLYAMHADLVRGEMEAAASHVRRSYELSGQLLAREPAHPRAGAFHLRAANFLVQVVNEREGAAAADAIFVQALAAVACNDAAKRNAVFMGYPYFDTLFSRAVHAVYRGDLESAVARLAEARSVAERVRYDEPRPIEFNDWDSSIASVEGWIALRRGDMAEFRRWIARAFAAARERPHGMECRVFASVGIVARVLDAVEIEADRGMPPPLREELPEIRTWLLRELEIDLAASESYAPGAVYTLVAQRFRAEMTGDHAAAAELDWKIYNAPDTSFQRAGTGPPGGRDRDRPPNRVRDR